MSAAAPWERSWNRFASAWWPPDRDTTAHTPKSPDSPLDRIALGCLVAGLVSSHDLRRARWCGESEAAKLLLVLLLARLRRGQGSVFADGLRTDLDTLPLPAIAAACQDSPLEGLAPSLRDDLPVLRTLLDEGVRSVHEAPTASHPLVHAIERPDGLVLAFDLPRRAEERLSRRLRERLGSSSTETLAPTPGRSLEGLHARQILAVAKALRHRTLVVAGGPGTGKTTVVARILQALAAQEGWNPVSVALCAPTGRAKARLQESIAIQASSLGPFAAHTLHSLLGQRPDGGFRHDQGNPLPYHLVVLDEASMVDQALFSGLLEALHPTTRLIVLGDPDQLPSVEAGGVFGDLVAHLEGKADQETGPFVRLVHTWRNDGEIRALAEDVNRGSTVLADTLEEVSPSALGGDLRGGSVRWLSGTLDDALEAWWTHHALPTTEAPAVGLARRLGRERILCATHGGLSGRERVNDLGDAWLARHLPDIPRSGWLEGRPLLLTRNKPALDLWNGDLGLATSRGGIPSVEFATRDGSVAHPVGRLEGLESAWAITIHKAQGSEFDHVLIVLPEEDSPLLTRQILYTGLTRARRSLWIWGRRDLWAKAVARREDRSSPLFDPG